MYHDTFSSPAVNDFRARASIMSNASADAVAAVIADDIETHDADGRETSTAANATPDPRMLAFEILKAGVDEDADHRFLDGLRKLSLNCTPVPWTTQGPSLAAVIRYVGVEPTDEIEKSRFAMLLSRATHLLVPAEGRNSDRRARRGRQETTTGKALDALDDLPCGTPIPTWGQSKKVSWPALAEMLGLDVSKLVGNIKVRTEVHQRLADGRLTLGRPYVETPDWRTRKAAASERLVEVIRGYAGGEVPRPLPIDPFGRNAVMMTTLLDEAKVHDPRMRSELSCHQGVRAELARVAAIVGTKKVQPIVEIKVVLPLGDLVVAGVKEAADQFLERNPTADAEATAKAGRTEASFINRAMRLNDWVPTDDIVATLLAANAADAIAKGCNGGRGDVAYLKAMERWCARAKARRSAIANDLPFEETLAVGIRALGLTVKAFAESIDMPPHMLQRWISGKGRPTSHQLNYMHRIEKAFGDPKGELVDMLGVVRGGRNNTQRKTVKLADGRTVALKKYLRYLPAEAIDWPEERLAKAVADADDRHYNNKTVNTIRQREVARIARNSAKIPSSAPILKEWADLKTFKTTLNDPNRYVSKRYAWRTTNTIGCNEQHMRGFALWCVMPKEEGGLGLDWGQVSFVLFLNPQVTAKYVFYRIRRFRHLTLEGRELGPMLSATEGSFLKFAKGLLDLKCGWLTQSPHMVMRPQIIDVEFTYERMAAFDGKFSLEEDEQPTMCRVMDGAMVDRIQNNWLDSVLHAWRMTASLVGVVEKNYEMIRDPFKLVGPIINHAFPIAVVIRAVKDALTHARPIEVSPMQHAMDYRNAVAMLLLATVVFRSETMRDLEWRADGTGNVVRTKTGYDVIVAADSFKNGASELLFGPSYRRHDYERGLGKFGSLTKILDYYLEVCRPILLKGRASDLLFPTGQSAPKWSHKTFNAMITNWTRTWSVRNVRTGTGMTGVKPWGPHAIRHIVATHIILHFPGESRWEQAARVLGCGVDVVRRNYAFVEVRRELAKFDPVALRAMEIGFGNEDLASFVKDA